RRGGGDRRVDRSPGPRGHRLHVRARPPVRHAAALVVAGRVRWRGLVGRHPRARGRPLGRRRALADPDGAMKRRAPRFRPPTMSVDRADADSKTPGAPLAGIKVVEIAQNLAGPFAGEILARLGADVVKVERPDGGDDARGWGPPFLADLSSVFHAANASKRSITLDLRSPGAVAWLVEYLGGVDVLVQNLRPGVIEAFAGLMMVNGEEGGPPIRMGTSVLDSGTGMWAALGVLAALVERQRTGRGAVVDTSLFETGLGWLANHFASYRISGTPPVRHRTGSTRLVVFEGFETKNGPVIIAAANDRLFAKLAV